MNILWHISAARKTLALLVSNSTKLRAAVPASAEPAVYFHFSELNYRFYLPVVRAFHAAGYSCYIHFDYKFIGNGELFFSWIRDLERVYLLLPVAGLENCSVIIRDTPAKPGPVKTLFLSDQVYDEELKPRRKNVLPFAIHPDQNQRFSQLNLDLLRNSPRKFRVFFSGNASQKGYKDEILNELHHKLSRNQILGAIYQELKADVSQEPGLDASGFQNKIVLLTSDFWVADTQKQHTIKKEDWFTYLASTDFFLACPGFSHPMCHNLIESMAVGAIPILEHPEYMQPPLVHGVNCIAFSGKADLITKLTQVLQMPDEEIAQMRQQVVAYFENYLMPAYLVQQLTEAENGTVFYYYSSAQSVNFFKKHFRQPQGKSAAAQA